MDFVLVVLGIIVVAVALYFVATLVFGPGETAEPAGEAVASPLPQDRDLTAADLRTAVLPVTPRGYRMADVDALIERMARQLDEQAQRDRVQHQAVRDEDYAPAHAEPEDDGASHEERRPAHALPEGSEATEHEPHRPAHAADE